VTGAARRSLDLLRPHPHRGDLIAAGAVPFAVAITLINLRMDGVWDDGVFLAINAVAAALIYGMGVLAETEGGAPRAYQSTLLVAGIALVFLVLLRLVDVLDIDNSSRNFVWTGVLLTSAAAWPSWRRNSGICALIAAITGGATSLYFVDWVFDPSGVGTFRWILLLLMLGFVGMSVMLRDWRHRHSVQLINAAGLAALGLAFTFSSETVGSAVISSSTGGSSTVQTGLSVGWGWQLVILVAGCALIAYSGVDREWGPAYVGFAVLVSFVVISARPPHGASLKWWPIILLVIGGAAIAAGLRPRRPLPPEPTAGPPATTTPLPAQPPPADEPPSQP
jgi:hypothetical protein